MPGKFAYKIKGFVHGVKKASQINTMSINRLRLSISADSTLPFRRSPAQRTRSFADILKKDLEKNTPFEEMKIYTDPFEACPLSALLYFKTEKPCRAGYTVRGKTKDADFCFDTGDCRQTHLVPVFGLYPDHKNILEIKLFSPENAVLSGKTVALDTPELPAAAQENENNCLSLHDSRGDLRYLLNIPYACGGIVPLSNGQFLIADKQPQTLEHGHFLPTHLYVSDLLGCVTQTYYVGNGIEQIYGEKEPDGGLLLKTGEFGNRDTNIEIDRANGGVVHFGISVDKAGQNVVRKITQELLAGDCKQNLVQNWQHYLKNMHGNPSAFTTMGWLKPPVPYKGASIETSAAVELPHMKEKYDMSFYISEDTLMIQTTGNSLQGVVFSKSDRIYQLDLTAPPLEDESLISHRYTLAVPFTEMHSGTYSVIVRFLDGGQETLADTITLSRTRAENRRRTVRSANLSQTSGE